MIPLRPLAVGELLDGTFTSVRHNPKATLGLAATVLTISQVISVVISAILLASAGDALRQLYLAGSGQTEPSAQLASSLAKLFGVVAPLTLLAILLSVVTSITLTGLLTVVIGRSVLGHKITAGQAWHAVLPRLPALLGAVLLTVGAYLAPAAAVAIMLVILALAGAPGVLIGIVAFFAIVGAIGFVVWFWVMFKMAAPAVILEGLGPATAMRRSWRLVRGSFWRIFGISLLASIIVSVAGAVLQIPFLILAQIVGFAGTPLGGNAFGMGGTLAFAAGAGLGGLILSAVGKVLAGAVTQPISAGVTVLLYVDLRMRREGLDLMLQHAAAGGVSGDEDAMWRRPADSTGPVPSPPPGSPPTW